jgi:hypothetical protein
MPFALMNTSLSFANNPTSGRWDTATNAPAGEPVRNHLQSFDRYVTLQYKGRFLKDRLGLDAKAYAVRVCARPGRGAVAGLVAQPEWHDV